MLLRLREKITTLSIVLIIVLFIGVLYLIISRTNLKERGSRSMSEGSSLVQESKFEYSGGSPVLVKSINILSTGRIKAEQILLHGNDEVEVYILQALLVDNEKPINVVVGILYTQNAGDLINWWIYNLLDEKEVTKSQEELLQKSYLESVFVEGTKWRYSWYIGERQQIPDKYLDIIMNISDSKSLQKIEEDFEKYGRTDSLLFPYLILPYTE